MTDVETQDRYITLLQRSGEPEEHAAGTIDLRRGRSGRPHVRRRRAAASRSRSATGSSRWSGPAGLFGEIAVIDREPRSGSAVAETDTTLVAIDKRRFWFLVQETPYFAEIVMRVMANRLRRETAHRD